MLLLLLFLLLLPLLLLRPQLLLMIAQTPARPMLVIVLQILVVDILLPLATLLPGPVPIIVRRPQRRRWPKHMRPTCSQLEQHHLHRAGHEEKSEDGKTDGCAQQLLHLADQNRSEHPPAAAVAAAAAVGPVDYLCVCGFVFSGNCPELSWVTLYVWDYFQITNLITVTLFAAVAGHGTNFLVLFYIYFNFLVCFLSLPISISAIANCRSEPITFSLELCFCCVRSSL